MKIDTEELIEEGHEIVMPGLSEFSIKTTKAALTRDEIKYEAVKLRKEGYSFREIGDILDISFNTARNYIIEALDELKYTKQEQAYEIREMVVRRDMDAIKAIYDQVLAGDPSAIDRLVKLNDQLLDVVGGRTTNVDITSGGHSLAKPIDVIEVVLTHDIPGARFDELSASIDSTET